MGCEVCVTDSPIVSNDYVDVAGRTVFSFLDPHCAQAFERSIIAVLYDFDLDLVD